MQVTDNEYDIFLRALPLMKEYDIVKLILEADFSTKKSERKNKAKLNAYRREAVLWSLFSPAIKLFFAGRHFGYLAPMGAEKELAEWMKPWLEMKFGTEILKNIYK